ncbi:Aminobenzoyl-glutamate utilization protein A like protein [Cavenderia fasciculata]|uniref:Aminobenzoyl-glutamate utilization protein A like protein n=1 Tax=Cavenderia fasciculata TaxID=261658 RepID=F4Q044_CACFS|nr:Aminobenzoyl-glutamate utilization protein A like protein [Cavenderia fasciculata]EGG18958.1 Aminobenzoyl-glutamate utilization protein A like protein [Cavenderia fasciculata]|eukprot:XP_004357420.1 Aminobenzoyl-glutamate utilization protein A like protein [Cavenderia fasciculata]
MDESVAIEQTLWDEMDGLTGCVAIYDSGRPGKTVALRFDIDCVGVSESSDPNHPPVQQGFNSTYAGRMHACGHDGHMTIGLGIAKYLTSNRETNGVNGIVKLVFQPAEEGVRGARPVAESGIVDDAHYYLSSHIGFIAESNEVVLNPYNFLCTTKYDFRFKGVPAHAGAQPHIGKNALMGACTAATQMMSISRHGSGMSRINVGVIRAGEGRNVVPATGELQIEVRGENEEINTYMCQQVERMAQGAALSYGLELETEVMGEAVDLTNDLELVDILGTVVSEMPVLTAIPKRSFVGSEDSTILAKRVQKNGGKSIYFVIGSNLKGGHHQSNFDFDESILPTAVQLIL